MPRAQQSGKNKFNFNKQVVATADFGVMTPIENKIMFPGDKFSVKIDHFTRLMPMPSPTFGKIKEKVRAFFVPCRILFKDWEDFISNNETFNRLEGVTTSSVAQCPQAFLVDIWHDFVNSSVHCTAGTAQSYDFWVWDYEDSLSATDYEVKYFKLTPYGRHVMKMLNGLGYELPRALCTNDYIATSGVLPDSSGVPQREMLYQRVSLLPLLAFWRAYIDWVVPSRFIRTDHQILLSVLNSIYKGVGLDDRGVYTDALLPLLYLPYSFANSDYFGSAFMTNYGYENNMASSTVINGVTGVNYDVTAYPIGDYIEASKGAFVSNKGAYTQGSDPLSPMNQSGATAFVPKGTSDDNAQISALTIRSLGALQDMVNRGKLAGSKIQDYLKVTYGIEPDNSALDISTYLGSHDNDIMIGDVMSNSDTYDASDNSGAVLGQYAGRALGGAQNHDFTYSAEEHGYFFITYELEVKSSYVQGLRPEVTATDRLDFFQPEFDGMDVDAIHMRELFTGSLFNDGNPNASPVISPYQTFGFTPRYSKYKVNFDSVLGDFRRHSVNTGLDSWFFARRFEPSQFGHLDWMYGINERFLRQFSETTSDNYDKIFMVANNSIDHFYVTFNLNFDAYRHMKSLETPLEFENKGENVKVTAQGAVD